MRTSLSLAAFALSLVACGSGAGDAPRTAANAQEGAKADAGPPVAGDVTVLSAGAEPRRALRYAFHVGRRETMIMDMKMAMGMTVNGQHGAPLALPVMRMTMTLDPRELTPEGDLRYDFALATANVIEEPTTPPAVLEAMKKEMSKLPGMRGGALVTSRGLTKSASFTAPPGASPQVIEMLDSMRDAVKDMSAPLPTEAVGRGARWKSIAAVDMRAMHVTRTVTYALTALDGDTGTLEATIEMSAPSQPLNSGRLPPGTTLTLDSLTATGRGTMAFDLQQLVPKSQFDIDSLAVTTAESEGKKSPLIISTKISVALARAKDETR